MWQGFTDRDVDKSYDDKGLLHRAVKDLDLEEVSILDRTRTPAYKGTLIMARDDENILLGEERDFESSDVVIEERQEPKQQEIVEEIDYSKAEELIKEMKGE